MKISAKKNYWIDVIMCLFLCINAISGLILWLYYSLGPSRIKLFGFSKYDMKVLHLRTGLIFLVFVLIHIFSHNKWILSTTKKVFKK